SSRRRHTRFSRDWSSDVCSSDLLRKWGRFYVDQISDPAWKPNPFDDLVFDPTQKRIIKSLVNSHQFPEKARDEEAQKGKGLIMRSEERRVGKEWGGGSRQMESTR